MVKTILIYLRERRLNHLYRRLNRLKARISYLQDLIDYEIFL